MFLDTQYHFAETLWYVEQVRDRYDLNLTSCRPSVNPDDLWVHGSRRVLQRTQGRAAAPSARGQGGLDDRARAATRRPAAPSAPIVSYDIGRGLVKVNPIAPWTDVDVDRYTADRELSRAPAPRPRLRVDRLLAVHASGRRRRGPRAGRWAGTDKLECGLHGPDGHCWQHLRDMAVHE